MFFLTTPSWFEKLKDFDQWLFLKINTGIGNPFFDAVLPFMRNSVNWAPLYIFLIVFALLNFRTKGAWWILFFLVTVALTDMTGNFFKHFFERPRPCLDPELYGRMRLLVDNCSRGFSFTSNHAANHFGMGMFFYLTTRPLLKKWAVAGLIWAALISFAQVYVGVHYPFDILGGTALGLIFGTLTGSLFNKRFGFAIFDNEQ